MEKVRPRCGQPSDQGGWRREQKEQNSVLLLWTKILDNSLCIVNSRTWCHDFKLTEVHVVSHGKLNDDISELPYVVRTIQRHSSSSRYRSRILATQGVVPQCRSWTFRTDVRQTNDEIVRSVFCVKNIIQKHHVTQSVSLTQRKPFAHLLHSLSILAIDNELKDYSDIKREIKNLFLRANLLCKRFQRTVHPHKWSPVSYRSSAEQGKFAGHRPTFYRWATQPTYTNMKHHKPHPSPLLVKNTLQTVVGRPRSTAHHGLVSTFVIAHLVPECAFVLRLPSLAKLAGWISW